MPTNHKPASQRNHKTDSKGAAIDTSFGAPGNLHKSPHDYAAVCRQYHGGATGHEKFNASQRRDSHGHLVKP